MSAYYFDCVVTKECNAAAEFFELFHDAVWNRTPDSQLKIKGIVGFSVDDKLPLLEVAVNRESNTLEVSFETSRQINTRLFFGLAEYLATIEGIHFRARLFDSSCDGQETWTVP